MCIKNHMKGRLSPGSKKSWGAESQESQLDLQASWHQGKVVGVPRTALLRHLPATLCPASSRRYNTIDTRVSASPPTLSTLTLEGKSPNWQTFLTSHFILQPAKGIPCLLFFLQHWHVSHYFVADTCTANTQWEWECGTNYGNTLWWSTLLPFMDTPLHSKWLYFFFFSLDTFFPNSSTLTGHLLSI